MAEEEEKVEIKVHQPEELNLNECLTYNDNISFNIIPPTNQIEDSETLSGELIHITIDKSFGKYNQSVFTIIIDPQNHDIINIEEIKYKEISEDGAGVLKDIYHYLSRSETVSFRPEEFGTNWPHSITCKSLKHPSIY